MLPQNNVSFKFRRSEGESGGTREGGGKVRGVEWWRHREVRGENT